MNYYGAKELASSFRTVRKNTIVIADEIPEDQYGFRPTQDFRSISELLTHIAFGSTFHEQVILTEKRKTMVGFDFMSLMAKIESESSKTRTKTEIIALLKERGENLAQGVESLDETFLGESVEMSPGANPPSRTRFEMLAGIKEHEMHHRGQLMLIERMLGLTPHLTRERQMQMAAMRQAAMQKV